MAFRKLFVPFGLIFVAAMAFSINEQGHDSGNDTATINYRLPDNVMPEHYNIKLIPYIVADNFTFDGESSINIVVRRATRDISLHALNLTVDQATTSLINSDGIARTPVTLYNNNVTEILTFAFDDELLPGRYTLNMKFVGILFDDSKGFFRISYKNEEGNEVWLVATHFEATWARRAFPCWDEPALKATFDISIKHHRNYTALSNMPARGQTGNGDEDGTLWTHFETTPIMSTYLVAFTVSDYVRVPNADGTVNVWCRPQLAPYVKFAQEIAEVSGHLLTEYTNSSDKMPKMDHFVVPEIMSKVSATENWGLIVYRENSLKYNNETDTASCKRRIAVVATHEMAHQWFGNVVSPLWWSYVWLNEGFASFFENYILNQIFEDWQMMEVFVVRVQQHAFEADVAKQMKAVTSEVNSPAEIHSLFSLSSYNKAPVILRMLQHIITDEVFRKGIIKYLHTHQFSSVTPDDLWTALQAALDESDVPHDYRVKDIMDAWIEQRHYPMVRVTRNYDTGETILVQEHFRSHVENGEEETKNEDKWWIPLTYTTQTNPNFSNTLPTHWLRPHDKNVTIDGIDPNDWIIVNLQQTGYYIVNYDAKNWERIAEYLHSENYTKIHILNRAQIISDAYNLLIADQFDIVTFLNITTYLAQETNYVPWFPMFIIFDNMINIFELPESQFLRSQIVKILDGLVKNVGYEEVRNESDIMKIKRVEALKWACKLGHSECRRMATVKLDEHLADPQTYRVSPNLKEWTYCMGVMEANSSTWNKLLDTYIMKPKNTHILDFLCCSENPDININFLNMSEKSLAISDEEYRQIFDEIVIKHVNKESVLDYILANWEKAVIRGIDIKYVFNIIINNVYSEKRLEKINEFVENNISDEKILMYVQNKIANRKADLVEIYDKFQKIIVTDEAK